MYWRIGQFPELDHLSPEARRKLLRRVAWRAYLWIVPGSIMMGGMLAGCLGTIITQILYPHTMLIGVQSKWMQMVIMLWIGFTIVAYRFQLRFIRNTMRHTIAEGFRGQRPPFCLACGYDLAGQDSPQCPECGKQI